VFAEFDDVDGILGFGWGGDFLKSAAILNTLSAKARPEWKIVQDKDYVPMPRMFAFTASDAGAELQLGGYDPASILGSMHMAPMVGVTYSVNVSSIKYNGEELLMFSKEGPVIPPNPNRKAHDPAKPYRPGPYEAYSGLFDSGTTCNLIPDSTVFGVFSESPYQVPSLAVLSLPLLTRVFSVTWPPAPAPVTSCRWSTRYQPVLRFLMTIPVCSSVFLQINGRTFMLPVSDFDCLESAGDLPSVSVCV
jgi:hypothetical protein